MHIKNNSAKNLINNYNRQYYGEHHHENIFTKFAISDYLPRFVVKLIFRSVYKPPEKLDENLRRDITYKYYKEEINTLEKLIKRDLNSWLS